MNEDIKSAIEICIMVANQHDYGFFGVENQNEFIDRLNRILEEDR